jgi:hypothetical protein
MLLGVLDRLALLNTLPEKGDLTTIKIVRELREQLSFSEEEHAKLGFTIEDDRIKWNGGAGEEREFVIGPKAHTIITDALQELDRTKQLTSDHLGIWQKFVGEGKEET